MAGAAAAPRCRGGAGAWARDGFVVLEPGEWLGPATLGALRADCARLEGIQWRGSSRVVEGEEEEEGGGEGDQLSEGIAAAEESGCVLEPLLGQPVPEGHPARVDAARYWALRATAGAGDGGGRAPPHDPDGLVFDALFSALPGAAAQALQLGEAGGEAGGGGGRPLLLFNEHFVVKPPRSDHLEFAWHTDAEEQLSMCVGPTLAGGASGGGDPAEPYVSLWVPLDDVGPSNGTLELKPTAGDVPSVEVEVGAGGGVVFGAGVWHRSGPNRSGEPRRVYYAQYSARPVVDRRGGGESASPLLLAIPCSSPRPAGGRAEGASCKQEMALVGKGKRLRVASGEEGSDSVVRKSH